MKRTALTTWLLAGLLAFVLVLGGCGGGGGGDGTPADGDSPDADWLDGDAEPADNAEADEASEAEPDEAVVETENEATEGDADAEAEASEETEAEGETEAETLLETDGDGEPEAEVEAEPEPELEPSGPTPTPGALVISEFMTDPLSSSRSYGQWLELTNTTNEAFSLYGCKLKSGDTEGVALGDVLIAAEGRLVLGQSLLPSQTGGVVVQAIWGTFALNAHTGALRLLCGESEIDAVVYDNTWPFADGRSLQLDSAQISATANDLASNWCLGSKAYFESDSGTPGEANALCSEKQDGDLDLETETDTVEAEEEFVSNAPNPKAGELVISEIMFRSFGYNGWAPWFEAKVLATSAVSLRGCGLVIGATSIALPNGADLPAGAYVTFSQALTGDAVRGFSSPPDFIWGSASFPTDSGVLRLFCNDGATVIDELSYDATWLPTVGHALTLDPGKLSAAQNDDLSAWCGVTDATQVFYFGNYGTPGQAGSACPVIVPTDGDLDAEEEAEADSEPEAEVEAENETVVAATPQPGEIVISEFMIEPNGLTLADGQWLELTNQSTETLDLKGCLLENGYGGELTIAGSLLVEPGARLVIAHNPDVSQNGGVSADYSWSGWEFDIADDSIYFSCNYISIDQVLYKSTTWPLVKGKSVSLDESFLNASDNDDPANWCSSPISVYDTTNQNFGTPGATNDACGSTGKRR